LSITVVLEAEDVGAFEGERFVDVGEAEIAFGLGDPKDVGAVGVVLVLGDVVVDQCHLFSGHFDWLIDII
jgi:hypothetical protein